MNRKFTLIWTLFVIVSLMAVPIAAAQGPVVEGGNPDFDATAAFALGRDAERWLRTRSSTALVVHTDGTSTVVDAS